MEWSAFLMEPASQTAPANPRKTRKHLPYFVFSLIARSSPFFVLEFRSQHIRWECNHEPSLLWIG